MDINHFHASMGRINAEALSKFAAFYGNKLKGKLEFFYQ